MKIQIFPSTTTESNRLLHLLSMESVAECALVAAGLRILAMHGNDQAREMVETLDQAVENFCEAEGKQAVSASIPPVSTAKAFAAQFERLIQNAPGDEHGL